MTKNRLYCGDNLEVLANMEAESVDLVYIDPPFKSDQDYNVLFWPFFLSLLCLPVLASRKRGFVAILSKKKRLFSGFTNADNVSNLDKLRKPNVQARLEYGCEFV